MGKNQEELQFRSRKSREIITGRESKFDAARRRSRRLDPDVQIGNKKSWRERVEESSQKPPLLSAAVKRIRGRLSAARAIRRQAATSRTARQPKQTSARQRASSRQPFALSARLVGHLLTVRQGLLRLKAHFQALPPVKWLPIGLVSLIILTGTAVGLLGSDSPVKDQKDVQGAAATAGEYDILVPDGDKPNDGSVKQTVAQGVSYQDKIDNILVTVSQQPLTDDLKASPDKIKKLAGDIGAKEEFTTDKGPAYLATADGENAVGQRVVFATDTLFVLISGPTKLSRERWTSYINSLELTVQ